MKSVASLSITHIAERLGVRRHKVEYALRKRGIKPKGRAGRARLYTERDARAVTREIQSRPQPRQEVSRG